VRTATSRNIVSFGDRLALGWHIFSAPIVWETANVVSRPRAVKRLLHALIERAFAIIEDTGALSVTAG